MAHSSRRHNRRVLRSLPRSMRVLTWVGIGLVVVLIAGFVTVVWTVRRSFPQTCGVVTLPGSTGPVDVPPGRPRHPADLRRHPRRPVLRPGVRARAGPVLRDGLPPARHRGRLAELFGAEPARDRQVPAHHRLAPGRRAGARPAARRRPGRTSRPTPRASTPTSPTTPAPRCRSSTPCWACSRPYAPEPWTPVDSLAWLKAMAWDLRGNMDDEIATVRW